MLEAIGFGVVLAFAFVMVLVALLFTAPLIAGYMDARRYREHRRQQLRAEAARAAYESRELSDPEDIKTSSMDSDSWNDRVKEWNS